MYRDGRPGRIGLTMKRAAAPWLALPLLAALAGCGPSAPMPLAQAEASCRPIALNQTGSSRPPVNVDLGLGVGRWSRGYGSIGVSTSVPVIPAGRSSDPEQIYRDCVLQRSGQLPSRPLLDPQGG